MKNNFKRKLIILILCFLPFSAYSMQMNIGCIASFNCNISTFIYRNDGIIKVLNDVEIDVSSLYGRGTISAINKNNIKASSFDYTGTISAGEECTIKAATFGGTATIEAPCIIINCDEFNFCGTISCQKQCIIYCKKSFDMNMFKRNGNGKFKIIISSHEIKRFSFKDLSSITLSELYSKCLNLTEEDIDNKIKEIRTHAVLNIIEDKALLEDIKTKLQEKVNFHQERVHEQEDKDSLHNGLTKCSLSTIGLFISYLILKNDQNLAQRFDSEPGFIKLVSAITAGISLFPAAFSYVDFYNWRNPCHQEKYDQLKLIITKINQALSIERVIEETIIELQ